MRAILVPAQTKPAGIGLARIPQRVQIGHRGSWQHPFILHAEHVGSRRHHRQEPLPLPEQQPIHRDFLPGQLHLDVRLKILQSLWRRGFQLDIYRAVDQGLLAAAQACQQLRHVLEVSLRPDSFLHVVPAPQQLVPPGGRLDDGPLLLRLHRPGVYPQGHPLMAAQAGQDGLLLGGRRVFLHRPHTPPCVAAHAAVRVKPDGAGQQLVKEILHRRSLLLLHGTRLSALEYPHLPSIHWAPSTSGSVCPPASK